MTVPAKSQLEILVEKLDRELIARGAQIPVAERFYFSDQEFTPTRECIMNQTREIYQSPPPLNDVFSHIDTPQLVKLLLLKVQELNKERGIWGDDSRMDFYQIKNEKIKSNATSVAAICRKEVLAPTNNGSSLLKVKNYGSAFNLNRSEPFRRQPISSGLMRTGFLVDEDIIATAGHCTEGQDVTDLRFLFGFKMKDSDTPITQVADENIYKGTEIVRKVYDRSSGADWAIVKLDRKVVGQSIVILSKKDISINQSVYMLGYPCGLPLKYTSNAQVRDINESFFSADLNVYCSNSGSPVFNKETHEVIGIVVRGDNQDFRWTGEGWLSVVYPNSHIKNKEPQCTRVSNFIGFCG
jgi:V8-like Glu-specific endopeptidase